MRQLTIKLFNDKIDFFLDGAVVTREPRPTCPKEYFETRNRVLDILEKSMTRDQTLVAWGTMHG